MFFWNMVIAQIKCAALLLKQVKKEVKIQRSKKKKKLKLKNEKFFLKAK